MICISYPYVIGNSSTGNSLLSEALRFIDSVQQPINCHGMNYTIVDIGIGGGFAAQFQLAASDWMRVFASHNYSIPVLIKGRLFGYSDGIECKHVSQDWTCYFQPMSRCQDILLSTGTNIGRGNVRYDDNMNIPPQFKHK